MIITFSLAEVSVLALVALMVAADPDADARAALALAIAARPAARPVHSEYEALRHRAAVEGRPLIVWVGVRRADLERPDWIHYHCEMFPGARPPCVVLGRVTGGEVWRVADLPAGEVTAAKLQSIVAPVVAPTRCGPGGCW